jgi:hypothetical protein
VGSALILEVRMLVNCGRWERKRGQTHLCIAVRLA